MTISIFIQGEWEKCFLNFWTIIKCYKKICCPYVFWRKAKKCIFLEKYKCSIYEVRPVICRMYGMCLPCGLIKNKEVVFQEGRDLTNIQLIIGDEIIKQRNYPLFYFFLLKWRILSYYYEEAVNDTFSDRKRLCRFYKNG